MIGKLKSYALLILSGLLTVSVFLLSIFGWRTRRLKKQRDQYKATAQKSREVMEADNEIEAQTRSRRADLLKERNDTGNDSLFSDANSLRRNPRD